MVDPVGYKPATKVDGPARVAAPQAPRPPVAHDGSEAPVATGTLTGTAAMLGARAPVDGERVERIRKAIAEGRFPISPATVADRLLALQLEWHSHDPA